MTREAKAAKGRAGKAKAAARLRLYFRYDGGDGGGGLRDRTVVVAKNRAAGAALMGIGFARFELEFSEGKNAADLASAQRRGAGVWTLRGVVWTQLPTPLPKQRDRRLRDRL